MPKLTELVGKDARRIVTRPPIVQPASPHVAELCTRIFARYCQTLHDDRRILAQRFHIVDVALKVVGVGSVGTRCFILLLESDGVPFFLQVKEAVESVLAPYAGGPGYEHQGSRVVAGQRIMQAASDVFLGWTSSGTKDYYVRQFRDMKGGVNRALLDKQTLPRLARLCGIILARAHARSGDPAVISGYLGKGGAFDTAIVTFAARYADQNEKDYVALQKAVRRGNVAALTGT